MQRVARNRPGFTLIEAIASIVVLAALASVASFITVETVESYMDADTTAQLQAEATVGLDRVVREIRMIDLDASASGIAPDIDSVTADSIAWNHNHYDLSLVGTQLIYSASGVTRANAWTTGLTHAVATGLNRTLLLVVGYENGGSDPGVSSVTYGGQSLVPIVAGVAGTTTCNRVELWYLNEAGIAAASGSTFVVTWGGA